MRGGRLRRDRRFAVARPDRVAAPRPPLAVRALAAAARRVLDRRGDLGRHLARALDVDPAPPPPGRLAAALLHAARRSGCACSATARPRPTRSRSCSASRACRSRTSPRAPCSAPRRARGGGACDARPVPHLLRAGDAHVRARGAPVARRRVVICRGDPAREARVDAGLRRRDRAARVQPQLGALPLRRARRRDVGVRPRTLAPVRCRRGRCGSCSTRRGCRRCSRRRGTPARRGRRGRAFTTCSSRRAPSSAETRRSSHSSSSAARRSAAPVARADAERREIAALLTVIAVTVVVAFVASQVSPAWTARYFAVLFGPVMLVAGRALARARGLGLATLVALVFLYGGYSSRTTRRTPRESRPAPAPISRPAN